MKWHTLLVLGMILGISGCGPKEQAASGQAVDQPQAAETTVNADWRNEAFIEHMHEHADYLDSLNFALADGDLAGAMTPAYWLSGHDPVAGFPAELQQYVDGMRAAAGAVEQAKDLDTARAAAEEITVYCQGCHKAAGVISESD